MKTIVVINHKTTKFESNSQRFNWFSNIYFCCYQSQNYKIWKQFTTVQLVSNIYFCCYQSQNYKIWKQFTTGSFSVWIWISLLSITKLQNLKAIHNRAYSSRESGCVVINRKTTKFESNSQLKPIHWSAKLSCYQSQNYKIWKQFTTYWIGYF